MRLAMDRQGSSLSVTQLMFTAPRATRPARKVDAKRARQARWAVVLGVAACAASLGMLAGQVARLAVGG